jgi:hypothetical protein
MVYANPVLYNLRVMAKVCSLKGLLGIFPLPRPGSYGVVAYCNSGYFPFQAHPPSFSQRSSSMATYLMLDLDNLI